MRVPATPTSLWKAYGIQQLPGHTPSNNFLRNDHGGGKERSEGMCQYRPQYGFMNRFDTGGATSDAIVKTGQPHTYVRNDYDHASLMASLRPVRRDYHPDSVSTQSSASRHRLNQRFMGSGIYDWNHDVRTDAANAHTDPVSDTQYPTAERESDAMVSQQQQQFWRENGAADVYGSPAVTGEARQNATQRSVGGAMGLSFRDLMIWTLTLLGGVGVLILLSKLIPSR